MDNVKFYGDLEKEEYLYYSKEGKKRIEEMERIFKEIKPYLGKSILDIGCGSGLFTFYFENKNYEVLGVDISKELIKEACNIKRGANFKSNFIIAHAEKLKIINKKFDAGIMFGNTLWDFYPQVFVELIRNIKNFAKEKFYLLIEYRSMIKEMIFDKEFFKVSFPYKNIAEIFENYDDSKSILYWNYVDVKIGKIYTSKGFAAWSSGFLEGIMNALNFRLEKRIKVNTVFSDLLDIYKLLS